MATQHIALSDAELEAARLEIEDPYSMPRICMDKPSSELTPEIVGEYHLPESHDLVWCCHCQGHHHRNGFVITNSTDKHYLLGSQCGPVHYGLEFKFALNAQKAKVKRRGVLDRLKVICITASSVKATIRELLHSEGLRLIDQKREELRAASDNALSALATSVATGMPLYEIINVRDIAAEQRRDAHLPDDKIGPPIYREERRSIGHVAGVGMIRERNDCRDHLLGLKGAIERVEALREAITDNFKVSDLLKAVREAEDAWTAAQAAIAEAERAPSFFSAENLNRLERWSGTTRSFQMIGEGSKLIILNRRGGERRSVVAPMQKIGLARLPRMKVD